MQHPLPWWPRQSPPHRLLRQLQTGIAHRSEAFPGLGDRPDPVRIDTDTGLFADSPPNGAHLLEVSFDLPSRTDIGKCVIDRSVVLERVAPTLVPRTEGETSTRPKRAAS